MAYRLPEFNLDVDIYSGPWLTRVLRVETVGNLSWGHRQHWVDSNAGNVQQGRYTPWMNVLLPALTDVRPGLHTEFGDSMEIPSGSGRWYGVFAVDDIGKGFDNEHRCAVVTQLSELAAQGLDGLRWPLPMP